MLQGLALAVGLPEDQAAAFADAVAGLARREPAQAQQRRRGPRLWRRRAGDLGRGGSAVRASGRAALRPPRGLRPTAAMLAPHVTIYPGRSSPSPARPRPWYAVRWRSRAASTDQGSADQMGQGDQADGTETDGSQGNGDALGAGTGDGSGTGGLGERAATGPARVASAVALRSGGTGGFGERSSGLSARGSGGQDRPEAGRLSPECRPGQQPFEAGGSG